MLCVVCLEGGFWGKPACPFSLLRFYFHPVCWLLYRQRLHSYRQIHTSKFVVWVWICILYSVLCPLTRLSSVLQRLSQQKIQIKEHKTQHTLVLWWDPPSDKHRCCIYRMAIRRPRMHSPGANLSLDASKRCQ